MPWAVIWRFILFPIIKLRPVPYLPLPSLLIAKFSLMNVPRLQALRLESFYNLPCDLGTKGTEQNWSDVHPCLRLSCWSGFQYAAGSETGQSQIVPHPGSTFSKPCKCVAHPACCRERNWQSQLLSHWIHHDVCSKASQRLSLTVILGQDHSSKMWDFSRGHLLPEDSQCFSQNFDGIALQLKLFLHHPPSSPFSFTEIRTSSQRLSLLFPAY